MKEKYKLIVMFILGCIFALSINHLYQTTKYHRLRIVKSQYDVVDYTYEKSTNTIKIKLKDKK